MADAVQAFRAISWLIVKWLLIVFAAIVVLTLLAIACYFAWQWYSYDRHADAISTVVSTARDKCDDDKYPVFVGFVNKASVTLLKSTFTLKARVKGRSTDIVKGYTPYTNDYIMKPGEGLGWCWTAPELTEKVSNVRDLEWSIETVRYTFQR